MNKEEFAINDDYSQDNQQTERNGLTTSINRLPIKSLPKALHFYYSHNIISSADVPLEEK